MVQFASEGELRDELQLARAEYVERTGDLFESDPTYERRIASFLEWYVLDRPVSFAKHLTPAKMYIEHVAPQLTTPELNDLRQLTKTVLSVFEFLGAKPEKMRVKDLLLNEKFDIFERRKPAGLEPGDLLEARMVPRDNTWMFSETVAVHPREARKVILKAAKAFRKAEPEPEDHQENRNLRFVHRLAYFSNRCDRYQHLDPKQIFADL